MFKDKKFLFLVCLIAIIVVSIFFRFWKLDSIPPGLYPDVAINGNNALDSIKNNDFKVFYADNNGREGLIIWLVALCFTIFGVSIWSLKVIAAIFGVLTVLGVYLLTKELFKKINENYEIIALMSSFFLAISFWHVNFSRIGFRAIMVPFFLVFGFYFLLKGLDNKKLYNFIFSGIFFGLGFYTYISYRFVVLLGLAVLIPWFFIYKKEKRQKLFLKLSFWCLLIMFLVALPIGLYFLQNPQDFFGRAAGVSILNERNPLLAMGKSLALHLGMFNFYGDGNWRHNYAGSPELLWPVGIFFIIGFILSIKDLAVSIKKKNRAKIATNTLLISWFFIMLLPCFFSGEGVPHSLRAIGVIPAVFIFAGLGAYWFFSKIRNSFKTKVQIMQFYAVVSIFFVVLAYAEFNKYFFEWGQNKEVYGAFNQDYLDLGNQLNLVPDDVSKYVVVNQSGTLVNGIPMPAQTPMFIERTVYGNTRAKYILPDQLENIKNEINLEKETVIFFMAYDNELAMKTMNLFPYGNFYDYGDFQMYKIEKLPPIGLPESTCGCSSGL